jgi:branched-chain amino acid transport system ATP-binding protein
MSPNDAVSPGTINKLSTSDQASALELSAVTAAYGRHIVIRELNLRVPPNSIVALLGPNGAGKTTVLRVAAGLLRPKTGSVTLDGVDVTARQPYARVRQGLCLIPEGRGIFRSLTVAENLLLFRPPWEDTDRSEQALDAFPDLRRKLGQIAGNLSGGQQQMLALTRIYLARPKVALLDEISLGLAPKIVNELFEFVPRLVAAGTALLLVEQYVNRALKMCDHVYLLNQGQVTFAGEPASLDQAAIVRDYLGEAVQKRLRDSEDG